MNRETRREIGRQWNQCSDFIKNLLLNRFQAIEAMAGKQDWLKYLADEFGVARPA
jgi:hypothetical protein